MDGFNYSGNHLRKISFPIGGIGSGCIGLDGTGRLRDWEIFNRPNKLSVNGYSHFSIRVDNPKSGTDARVLHADYPQGGDLENSTFGFGMNRYLLEGLPHFKRCVFNGRFPIAAIDFIDDTFLYDVKMTAFNPFIPGNEDDSSIPAGFFVLRFTNPTDRPVDCTLALTLTNPAKTLNTNQKISEADYTGFQLLADDDAEKPMRNGSVLAAVPGGDGCAVQRYWYRGLFQDSLNMYWHDFSNAPMPLEDRSYHQKAQNDTATLAVTKSVEPGKTWTQRFLIAWYYPMCFKYWESDASQRAVDSKEPWRNWYAVKFKGVGEVAAYSFKHWNRLETETDLFQRALFSSALPRPALDAVSANLSVLKSPTCLRLPDGSLYGFEGCAPAAGCCEGSCTHVWNYQFALPYLFPKLQRSMCQLDFMHNQDAHGAMAFRLKLPLGSGRLTFRPCVDGQMGGLIKLYREWKISGDTKWLQSMWPYAKKSLEYAWSPHNADLWDPNQTGVISGRQHHTLDMELFGPNAWLNGFYLGALKAASEMAKAVGETGDAAKYLRLYQKGRKYTDERLFNEEYYIQEIDLKDQSLVSRHTNDDTLFGGAACEVYWDDRIGEVKYQIGNGCGIDQVFAQWMCELSGIGEILNPEHVRSALLAIYRNNYRKSMRNMANPARVFALNDEAGTVICSWPHQNDKPVVPILYAQECMSGFEYQAASHMLMNGLSTEGLNVLTAVRDRYNGGNRNPWNEVECGSHYVRSMASYGLLLAYSGMQVDMTRGLIGFKPLRKGKYFWAVDGAWGIYEWSGKASRLEVLWGRLSLEQFSLHQHNKPVSVLYNQREMMRSYQDGIVYLSERTAVSPLDEIRIVYAD